MQPNKRSLTTASHQIRGLLERLPTLAARLAKEAVFFIYPPTCAGCSSPLESGGSEALCPACLITLELISEPYCPRCGIPYSTTPQIPHLCGDCLGNVHLFDRARATGFYRGILREIIHRFKYGGQTFLARPLAKMLAASGKELTRLHHIDLIVPVPLHSKRLRQRGFNQASLLARYLGPALKIPVDYASLKRFRWTEPQTGLTRRQRGVNVKGAFALTRPEKIEAKRILLLDDVFTTGETVNQCVTVLKKDGGAREVVVLTIARTVGM